MKKSILMEQIERLHSMNLKELRDRFEELYGFSCGNTNVRNLRKRITYRLQEIDFGGMTDIDLKILDEAVLNDPQANLEEIKKKNTIAIVGTTYTRIWKGKKYEVSVVKGKKFEYMGRPYKSLSAIARDITGTRWNGKVFFGAK